MELITSAANPVVKKVRALADRKQRRRSGLFVVEGLQPVWRALQSGWGTDVLVTAPEMLAEHPAAAQMVARQRAKGTPIAELSAELFSRISDRDGPSGLIAVMRSRQDRLGGIPVTPNTVVVGIEQAGNPGNLGTVIRTADAAGVAGLVLIGPSADPYSPTAVKASMGSIFAVPVVNCEAPELLDWARAEQLQMVASSGYADTDFSAIEYRHPVLLLMGSEGSGLSSELLQAADLVARIPMRGTAESLNLSVAAALMMYEAQRGRLGVPE